MAYHRDVSPLAIELMGRIARKDPKIIVNEIDMQEKLNETECRFLSRAAEKHGYTGWQAPGDYDRCLTLTLDKLEATL